MKSLQLIPRTLALALVLGALWSARASTTAATAPVGFVALPALANSDTRVSVPLARASVYQDAVASVAGTVLTVTGTPGWTTNQFVQSLPSQPDSYYVQFKTGSAAGHFYTVTANAAATLTVDWNGGTPGVTAGDEFELIPYWTLDTLFPASDAGVSFTASPSAASHNTELLFPDVTSTGINLPASATYYFFNGAWRKVGEADTTSFDSTALVPDTYVIQRNGSAASQLTIVGSVVTGPLAVMVAAQGGSAKQDNPVALRFAGTVTLAQSNLVGSGAFQASTSALLRKDELLVYDNAAAGINKPAAATYYFFNGAWRKVGSASSVDFGSTAVFAPGTGVLLRKAGTGGTAQDSFWNYTVTGL